MSVSAKKARELLWEQGELSWKLRGVQKEIRQSIIDCNDNVQVVVAGRRTGKSYTLCLMAIELCIKHPNAIVKYACPKQRMVSTIIRPIIREIIEDCPSELKPEWKAAEKIYQFPNGSEIHIAGTDNENAESLRGARADFAILDEAGFMDQLGYIVRSVISPILKTSRISKKLIMASTPSKSANHEFMEKFFLPMQAEGRVKVYTIHDNPNFDESTRAEILREYPLGEKDPEYMREYLCIPPDLADRAILPSFTGEIQRECVHGNFQNPLYCDRYVAFDIGGTDLHVVLFGYYNYDEAKLYIIDEIVADSTTNTEILAEAIKEKEKTHWSNPIDGSLLPIYKRVSDTNNKQLIGDLNKLHGISFAPTKKNDKAASINSLDVTIMKKQLVIHPRCSTLLYHLKFAEWNNARTDFKKLKDSPNGLIKGGHADALAALIYLHRNVSFNHNPYPSNWGSLSGPNVFNSQTKTGAQTENQKFFEKIFQRVKNRN